MQLDGASVGKDSTGSIQMAWKIPYRCEQETTVSPILRRPMALSMVLNMCKLSFPLMHKLYKQEASSERWESLTRAGAPVQARFNG
jgi:hypothetical protein